MNQQLSSLRSQLLAVQHQLPQLLEECREEDRSSPAGSTHCGEVRQTQLPLQPR